MRGCRVHQAGRDRSGGALAMERAAGALGPAVSRPRHPAEALRPGAHRGRGRRCLPPQESVAEDNQLTRPIGKKKQKQHCYKRRIEV